ncbi:MAG TPA: biotin/lipoyl-binding protein [Bacillota bacterium]|jgi:multidrug efflux pump subunit AcrA (membrane-fusion protein)|nr:biotin/lipoyl-binding protein [Bacillota bacterium]HQE66392.1 biotin/lipoyl-binding protein [Bacillota bacterium]HQI16685.1 biotin/lipoyl-binding protein [Bacillota bacterium]HQJ36624.1 biotin/lipoyl-binding protein [Bacillota bacterium]HRS21966.1 biotin/lipoyl-binding protein [Clostridia bacterium]
MFLRHKKSILIGSGILIMLTAVGIISFNAARADKAQSFETVSSSLERYDRLDFWGEVKYERIYDISIDFPAIVTDIKVKEGDHVSLGQVLVTLDMSEYLGTVDKLQHQLEAGQAELQSIRKDTGALEADIRQMQKDILEKTEELTKETNADLKILKTSLNLAKKEVENAKRDVRNNQALSDAGAITKNTLDRYMDALAEKEKALEDIETSIEKTKSALRTELDQLNILLKSKSAQLKEINDSNTANMARQESSVAVSRIDLEIMKNKSVKDYLDSDQVISCVRNGIVRNIEVINGSRLGVQDNPARVLQLIDADSIIVVAEVEEEFIRNITLDETVEIVPASDSSASIPGTVIQISNEAVEKDGKRIIKAQIKPEDPGKVLKPGYSVDVYVHRKE